MASLSISMGGPALGLELQDEGASKGRITQLNFAGAGVVADRTGEVGTATIAGGAGAPSDADYLVGTANASLTAEIVVGTTPGGELGGTWAAPTVDTTHSGSAHHTQSHDHSAAGDGTTLTPATLNLPASATPAQTAEGQAVWDSDDDKLTVGDGVARKTMAREDLAVMDGDAAGGELGGTYPSPTVAATHSGSAHHNAVTIGADAQHSLATQVLSGVAASQTQAGHAELATAAEINTGTDTGRVMPVDQFVASARNVRFFLYRVLDPATAHTVSTTVGGDLELPFTGTITEIGAYVDTAGTTGVGTIDVNLNGTTLMTTTKITIDTTEKSSRTAATAPVLTTTAVTVGDLITVDIDGIQTTAAKGLTIRLGIRQT